MIAVCTCATQRYRYSIPNFGRRVSAAIAHHDEGVFIFAGDQSPEVESDAMQYVKEELPEGWEFVFLPLAVDDSGLRNYKNDAQMLIAQMQTAVFSAARKRKVDACWSVESDVLVPPNGLRVSEDTLRFDEGYYDVAMVSYPSQGGGSFLGGRGNPLRHIAENIFVDERDVDDALAEKMKKREEEARVEGFYPSKEWMEEGRELDEELKKCTPNGNIFELNAKKWRQRGWMEYAYPAIGRGSILPTDWVGFGCTLMSKKALSLAHFDGYDGGGTQDLYICWNQWAQHDIKKAVITHVLCDHIVRSRDGEDQKWDKFCHIQSHHELMGDWVGHLRQRNRPFYKFVAGEQYDESNDGVVDITKPKPAKPAPKTKKKK